MDPFTTIKITLAVIEVIIEIIVAFFVIKKNPKYWLNRFFGVFFLATSIGFLTYIVYHFILDNVELVIAFVTITQMLFNTGFACLLMTWLIMKKSEVEAMKPKYIIPVGALWVVSIISYLIWPPTIDMADYALGIVHSVMPTHINILSNVYRIGVMLLAIVSYYKWSKKAEGESKRKMQFFTWGMCLVLGGILSIFAAGISDSVEFIFTIIGVIVFLVGTLYIFRALVKLQ